MHVIIQVHAEPSARGCVIEIWIESLHSGPRAESLAWTSKISENRGARTSLIWAGENETLKNIGVGSGGTLSSATEKREFALQIGGARH